MAGSFLNSLLFYYQLSDLTFEPVFHCIMYYITYRRAQHKLNEEDDGNDIAHGCLRTQCFYEAVSIPFHYFQRCRVRTCSSVMSQLFGCLVL